MGGWRDFSALSEQISAGSAGSEVERSIRAYLLYHHRGGCEGNFVTDTRLPTPLLFILELSVEPRKVRSMSQEQPQPDSPLYSQIDVANGGYSPTPPAPGQQGEISYLLRGMLAAQDRQNELLEELVNSMGTAQKQRANELGQWKQANPRLAKSCRAAAELLSKIQTEFLEGMTEEIRENYEALLDGEFMLNEFVDRFGPRMAHLNGLLQVLSQLSATSDPANTPNTP